MNKTLKYMVKNVCFLLILLKIGLLSAQNYPLKKIVVIDPGHGGTDSGAVGLRNQEKDITLGIALALKAWNSILFENELEMHLTRYSDTLINLSERSRMAKMLHADAFISIHCNAANKSARGLEVFVPKKKGAFQAQSYHLGQWILNEFHFKLNFVSRGVKEARFQVLAQAVANYPAILIEIGFITHEDEAYYFSKEQHLKAVALAILMGLKQHLNSKL
ncbi:hypothetical protein BKP44_13580 [Formosa algae]|nr:hypothetical protein BKP44_13580 [Formosa algae]